jgi:hypothetical protein
MPTESFCCSAVASIARGELSQAELEQLPPSTIEPPIDSPHTGNRGGERLAEMLDALSNFAEAGRAPADLIIAYELLRKSREA